MRLCAMCYKKREEGITLASQPLQKGSAWHGRQILQRLTCVLHEAALSESPQKPFLRHIARHNISPTASIDRGAWHGQLVQCIMAAKCNCSRMHASRFFLQRLGSGACARVQEPREQAHHSHLARLRHNGDVQCASWRRKHAPPCPGETLRAPSARILLQAWPLHIDSKLLRACTCSSIR